VAALGDELAACAALAVLHVSGVQSVTPSFARLPLDKLHFGSATGAFPAEIFALPRLRGLTLASDVRGAVVPEAVAQLRHLRRLDVSRLGLKKPEKERLRALLPHVQVIADGKDTGAGKMAQAAERAAAV
jgi:hypothetical protein